MFVLTLNRHKQELFCRTAQTPSSSSDLLLFASSRGDLMRRREFITLLGSAAGPWPLAARAQQAGQLPIIGYMGQGTPAAEAKRVAAFVERLRELSWIEGRTVLIEYRWTEGRS